MSVTPQLFDPALTSPFSQPVYYGTPGPYENGTDKFFIADSFDTGTHLQQLVAYKLSAGAFSTIFPGFANNNQNGNLSPYYPRSGGDVITVGWQGREGGASIGNAHVTTFNKATGVWGTDNDSGLSIRSDSIKVLVLPGGNLVFLFDTTIGVTGRQVGFITYSGSWSSPTYVSPGTGTNFLDGAIVDGDGNFAVVWDNGTTAFYTRVVASVPDSAITALTLPANFQTSFPFAIDYDPHSDTIIWAYTWGTFGTRTISTLLGSPTIGGSPSFSVVDVANDPSNTFSWDQVSLALNGAGKYDIFVWGNGPGSQAGLLQHWASMDLATWVGPAIYYDEVAQPPSPPPDGIELLPVYSQYLADGTIGVTVGMFYPIDSVDFCGVLVYLVPGGATMQTLELTKIVVGGPAVPGDWNLSAETGSPPTGISGDGHVGPSEVAAATYELGEEGPAGERWGDAIWGEAIWGGTYTPGAWDCGGATMPTTTSVIVPPGGVVACQITNTFAGPPPPPPPPIGPGANAVGCFELIRLDVTLTPAKRLPVRGSVK